NHVRPLLISAFRAAIEHRELRRALAEVGDRSSFAAGLCAVGLTPREAEGVRLVALGRSNQDVAIELQVSDRTVAKHLERAFRKLGVSTRSEASARAWGLMEASNGSAVTGPERPALRVSGE